MTFKFNSLVHSGIQSLSPYVPGRSVEEVAREQGLSSIVKLASNENPLGCSPLVPHALSTISAQQLSVYPIANQHYLHHQLTKQLGVEHDMLLLANGSDSLFTLLMTCFALHSDKTLLTHDYAFMGYHLQAQALGIPVVYTPVKLNWDVDVDAMIEVCNDKTALIFLANPNNPTGVPISTEAITRLLNHIPKTTLLVIDEAYHEYALHAGYPSSIPLLSSYPNLIITRTFSKIYGLASLRLGYAVANPEIIALIQRIQLPFAVNLAAIVAAEAALEDQSFIQASLQMNDAGLQQLTQGMDELGVKCLPTAGNFIMFDCLQAAQPIDQALQRRGVIVRPLGPYHLPTYLRITIGTAEQNTRFLASYKEIITCKVT